MKKHYTHESEELNALLGKKVKVTLWDDTTITGILTRAKKILQYFKKFFEKSIKSFDKNCKRIII